MGTGVNVIKSPPISFPYSPCIKALLLLCPLPIVFIGTAVFRGVNIHQDAPGLGGSPDTQLFYSRSPSAGFSPLLSLSQFRPEQETSLPHWQIGDQK